MQATAVTVKWITWRLTVEKVTNGDELRQRLIQASGEEVYAWGWGSLGMKNVFVGATPSALLLEFITFSQKTKEMKRIPYDELEFIHAFKGDASTPKLLKMNLEGRINESITGTLVFKTLTDRLTYITFRKIPRHDRNDQAPFRITEHVSAVRPEKVHLPDLDQYMDKQSSGGCTRQFFVIWGITALILLLALGIGSGKWDMAFFGGIGTGMVLGAVFAPLWNVFKRIFTGMG